MSSLCFHSLLTQSSFSPSKYTRDAQRGKCVSHGTCDMSTRAPSPLEDVCIILIPAVTGYVRLRAVHYTTLLLVLNEKPPSSCRPWRPLPCVPSCKEVHRNTSCLTFHYLNWAVCMKTRLSALQYPQYTGLTCVEYDEARRESEVDELALVLLTITTADVEASPPSSASLYVLNGRCSL